MLSLFKKKVVRSVAEDEVVVLLRMPTTDGEKTAKVRRGDTKLEVRPPLSLR